MTEIDPWEVAKAAAEDHFLPRMDGTVAPDHVQQAFINGFAGAVEQIPSKIELAGVLRAQFLNAEMPWLEESPDAFADAVLALIRERYEGES